MADTFTSPYMISRESSITADPENTNAGKQAIEKLFKRGALRDERGIASGGLDPTAIAIMNFVYEFRYMTTALIERAFRCPGRKDAGYYGVSRISSGWMRSLMFLSSFINSSSICRRPAVSIRTVS